MRIMAFIPARGGSKGILRKNLVPLAGKPLIQYTIEAALQAESVDEVFLSSDDDEIIGFAQSLGVDVPYKRPACYATDEAPMMDAVRDGIRFVEENFGGKPDVIVMLQPTSPLRTAEDIDGAVHLFKESGAHSVVSVHEMVEHPYECVRASESGWSYLAVQEKRTYRRQDYSEKFYYINGAVYVAGVDFLDEFGSFVETGKTALYTMPRERGVDIDEPMDLKRAEAFLT